MPPQLHMQIAADILITLLQRTDVDPASPKLAEYASIQSLRLWTAVTTHSNRTDIGAH